MKSKPFSCKCLRSLLCGLILLSLCACSALAVRDNGQALMAQGKYEEGIAVLQNGTQRYPDSLVLHAALTRAQGEAVTKLIVISAQAKLKGNPDGAEQALQRAAKIDPANQRVKDLLLDLQRDKRLTKTVADANALIKARRYETALNLVEQGLKETPTNADLLTLQRTLEMENRQQQGGSIPHLTDAKPVTLEFRDAPLRMVLDVLSKHSDISFIIDKDVKPDVRATVFLKQTSIENALDLITSTNQLATKVISPRSVLIYPNTPDKQKEYQDQIFRIFYLSYANAKDLATMLKAMFKLREVQTDERLNTIMIRENPSTVRMVERVVALQDLPEPEVVMEMEVMEIATTDLTNLGIALPESATLSLQPLSGESSLTLKSFSHINGSRVKVTIADTTLNMEHELTDVNLLANPRIRAKNKEKAKIMVGDKVPVFTSTTTSTGVVSESVQMLDVGLKLEVEPTISLNDDVSIKVALEVSTLGSTVTSSTGSVAYQIGTRNANTVLRLHDGETQVLAGLINREERKSAARFPGLGDLPVVGRLFSSTTDNDKNTEIVLAITPHIVSNLRRPDINQTEFWSGSEKEVRLRPLGLNAGGNASNGSNSGTGGPVVNGNTVISAASAGNAAGVAVLPARVTAGAGAAAPFTSLPADAAPPSMPAVHLAVPNTATQNETISVPIQFNAIEPIRGLSLVLAVDPKAFEVVGVEDGALMRAEGKAANVTFYHDKGTGLLTAGVMSGSQINVKGAGDVMVLKLKLLSKGDRMLRVIKGALVPERGEVQNLLPGTQAMLKVN